MSAELKLQEPFAPSSAGDKARQKLATLMKRMPKLVKRLSAATVIAALATGDTDKISITDLAGENASKAHIEFCEHVMQLDKLSVFEKFTLVSIAEKYKHNPTQLKTIIEIAKACNKADFNVNAALSIATLESDLGINGNKHAWKSGEKIEFTIGVLAKQYDAMVQKYESIVNAPENRTADGFQFAMPEPEEIIAELYLSRFFGNDRASQLIGRLFADEKTEILNGLPSDIFKNSSLAAKLIFGRENEGRSFSEIYYKTAELVSAALSMQDKQRLAFEAEHPDYTVAAADRTIGRMASPVHGMHSDLERAFANPIEVAQSVTDNDTQVLENSTLKVPHTYLSGPVTEASVDAVIAHMKAGIKKSTELAKKEAAKKGKPFKQPYYYIFVNSHGGEVDAGFKLLEETNKLIDQGIPVRVVIENAASIAAVYAFGVKGPRMITENASVITHASYYYNAAKKLACKIGEACLTEAQSKILIETRDHFARIAAEKSCALSESIARLLFPKEDKTISVNDMIKFGLADHRVRIIRGWVDVIHDDGTCEPVEDEIGTLIKLADPAELRGSQINASPRLIQPPQLAPKPNRDLPPPPARRLQAN